MAEFPRPFLDRMQALLGAGYDAFRQAMDMPPVRGVRVNRLKCDAARFAVLAVPALAPAVLSPVPFSPDGFAAAGPVTGRHPWHHAGLFYMQEPSAMAAVTAAGIRPGMRVLDLCAAPGGKSTQAAAELQGEGLLVSNEVVPGRAKALLSNIERAGVRNALILNEQPERLCEAFRGYFDVVLVDAPCSGEGLFRRDPSAAAQWTPQLPEACARRQMNILRSARLALREGGVLVYSTCTFSPMENEGVVGAFLRENPDFAIEDIPASFGRPAVPGWAGAALCVAKARRIFPQDGGEGHFVARLRKCSAESCRLRPGVSSIPPDDRQIFGEFFDGAFSGGPWGELWRREDQIILLPSGGLPDTAGLRVLRAGVPAGTLRGRRFEPAHALYLAADSARTRRACGFPLKSPVLAAFLHGEEIEAPDDFPNGYTAVKAEGFIVGFGKVSGGKVKNHYPKGLRNL